jgi:antitoxin (DNA-binding transcriptional repressor) of toxin-antitoxin stability system
MRFTGIKELKQKTMSVIEACKTEDVIITAYGKPTAILHHITEEDLADYLLENDPLFHRKIEDAYTEYALTDGLTADKLIKKLESHRGAKKV